MYQRLLFLGPLAPIFVLAVFSLFVFFISRVNLLLIYWERVSAVNDYWWVFPIGLRMDLVFICILLLIPTLVLLILPGRIIRSLRYCFAALFSLLAVIIVYMEVASIPFVAQYDSRPNQLFINYLIYPREVFGTIFADYKFEIFVAVVLAGTTLFYGWRLSIILIRDQHSWSTRRRLMVLPIIIVLFLAGGRSSFGVRPANISTAAFSDDHLTNQLALNSSYTLGYALYRRTNEVGVTKLYGNMSNDEAVFRVRRHSLIPQDKFSHDDIPTLHRQTPLVKRDRPYNLVIFLQESMGAEYVGSLGGLPLTPNMDRLGNEGMFFTQLYSTGTRTVRGIEATTTGFLPTPSRSVVTLGLSQHNFFTIADLLGRHGYSTEFIYGGAKNFDNMASFFLGNGFSRVITEEDFPDPVFHGTWGVSDEDLVRRANAEFVAHGEKPFFALMLSTSNHAPFEYPQGRIPLFEQPSNTVNNAIKYADYAIGEFFRLAKKEDYFRNTVFLVVADHNTRVYGADLVPINKFHIPAFVIGPDIKPVRYTKLASQLDLLPTLLDLTGLETTHPMIGRNLLQVADEQPGHAIMQYGLTHAFQVGEDVIIHQPYKKARQFKYQNRNLVPAQLDAALVRDALAHIQLPSMLYRTLSYRLPDAGAVEKQWLAFHSDKPGTSD